MGKYGTTNDVGFFFRKIHIICLLDNDESPNGQGQGQSYANGVKQLREMHVKQYENRRAVSEQLLLGQYEIFVDRKRYVFDHDQNVGYRQAGQNTIDGCFDHVFASQDDDVQNIGYGAEKTHDQCRVNVISTFVH